MNLSNLKTAQSLINHLIKWGELTRFELNGIGSAQDWITTLENAGVLHTAANDIWSLSPEFWSLLREDSEKALRIPKAVNLQDLLFNAA